MRRDPFHRQLLAIGALLGVGAAFAGTLQALQAADNKLHTYSTASLESLLEEGPWSNDDAELLHEIVAWRQLCDSRERSGCGGLALSYSRRAAQLTREPQWAVTLYREACRDGYPWACYELAELARLGEGMPRDAAAAAALLNRTCVAGESRACLRLGQMLESGDGVAADSARAESLYEQECAASRTAGCWRLGLFLAERQGDGDAEGAARLREAFRKGCTGGNGESCHRLADLLEAAGETREAVSYFGRACDRNDFPGCFRWAESLEAGVGVAEPDEVFAQKLYRKACRGGVAEACERAAHPAD
jgi:TPR repeat protein